MVLRRRLHSLRIYAENTLPLPTMFRLQTLRLLAVAFGLLASSLTPAARAQAPAAPPAPVRVTEMEGITEFRLANGLRVLLFPDQTKQTITVNITYLVGSRHEAYGETGMAHLLEHLVFKGTPKHPNIPQELTEHGAQPNGTTSFDRTNYFETFAATDENLKWALDLEADRMVNSFIAKKDLESEMTVVRNEFESGENNPIGVLVQRMLSTAFLWHNYGNTTIGARADIENVPIERLQGFYRRYYQPDNAVLMVTGKFDPAKTLALINEHFGVIPRPSRELIPTYTLDPTQDGEREVNLRRSGDNQVIGAMYKISSGIHPDFPAIATLSEALTAQPNGKLYQALVPTKKAAAAFGQPFQLREPGMIFFGALLTKEQELPAAEAALFETLESKRPPITDDDVARAKATLLKNIDLALNNSTSIGLQMSEWIARGDWRLFFWYREQLKKVTTADVNRVAAFYLKPANRTTGRFYPTTEPDRVEIPATPTAESLLKDFKLDTKVAEGEAFDPSPENIERRTVRVLPKAGLQLALLSKKTRGASVNVRMNLRLGDAKSLAGKAMIADLTADMLDRGTATKTRQQIKDAFDKLKARVFISGSGQVVTVNVETVRENLAPTLDLVAELLKSPSFPATELTTLIEENVAGLQQQRSEPQFLASIKLQKHLRPYPATDVRYVMDADESIAAYKAATLDQVKAFHASHYGAHSAQVAVVGDFDEAAVRTQLNQLFGSWRARQAYVRMPALTEARPAINEKILTPDKANAFFTAGLVLPLRDDDADFAALSLGNFMLGGGFLNSRLATRIRQKEGLSYGVGSGFNASALDRDANFSAGAIYAPQNLEKLEAAFNDELQKVLDSGFTAEEVAAAKSGWLQGRSVGRAQDGQLAGTLVNYLFVGRTMTWDAELEKKVAALTPADIQAAFKRHYDLKRLSIVKAGDFK